MRKKVKILLAVALAMLMVCALVACGEKGGQPSGGEGSNVSGAITFDTTVDGGVVLTKYSGSEASVVIPSTYNGKAVTGIGALAFSNSRALDSITIPSTVTSIGSYAFADCGSLGSVTFTAPSSVTSIGDYAFAGCSALASITIPTSVTSIGSGA
ncbi:MAG: leucine-rich repeat domain-containing protein, partial [Clostridia bacterium]